MSCHRPFIVLLVLFGLAAPAVAQKKPVTGQAVREFEELDRAVLAFMDRIGAQAATVAVMKDGRMLYSRGFGWSNRERRRPTTPDALMRIASVSKPITAAAVRDLLRAGKLSPDLKVFPYLKLKAPGGKPADPRVNDITVQHLLDHKGGWDSAKSFDPMFRMADVRRVLRLADPPTPAHVIQYMLTQPLQTDPGEKHAYSNFGFCVLGRVIERASGKSYLGHLQGAIFKPLGITDVKLARSASALRDRREVWYPVADDQFRVEVMDAHGGLIASAPALCRFMSAYWLNGERREGGRGNWTAFGSLPGTTAMARQRLDGLNVAVLLNVRREKDGGGDNDYLKRTIDEVLDAISGKELR